MKLGLPELIVILLIVLVLFGPRTLPKLGSFFGGIFGKLKKRTNKVASMEDENKNNQGTPSNG